VRMMFDERATAVNKWGCTTCKGEGFEDGDVLRDERNCSGKGRPLYLEFFPGQNSCPWSDISPSAYFWVNSWLDYDRWRILPFGGSDLMAYPAYFHEAFTVCETEKITTQNETAERDYQRRKKEAEQAKRAQRVRLNG